MTVALVYKPGDFSSHGKENLGNSVGIKPSFDTSSVMLYQFSYHATWEQGGGKEGMQVLVPYFL